MPLAFTGCLYRTLLEKVLLCGLMAACLLATTAAVVTLATVLGALQHDTAAAANVHLDILTALQLFLGVIAANLPYLKSPVERLLSEWGVFRPRKHAADASPDSFVAKMTHGSHIAGQLQELAVNHVEGGKEESTSCSETESTDSGR